MHSSLTSTFYASTHPLLPLRYPLPFLPSHLLFPLLLRLLPSLLFPLLPLLLLLYLPNLLLLSFGFNLFKLLLTLTAVTLILLPTSSPKTYVFFLSSFFPFFFPFLPLSFSSVTLFSFFSPFFLFSFSFSFPLLFFLPFFTFLESHRIDVSVLGLVYVGRRLDHIWYH